MAGKQRCFLCKSNDKKLYDFRNRRVCNPCIFAKLREDNAKIIEENRKDRAHLFGEKV